MLGFSEDMAEFAAMSKSGAYPRRSVPREVAHASMQRIRKATTLIAALLFNGPRRLQFW